MADGPVGNLPAGMDAYAGYVDDGGDGVTYPGVVAAWPDTPHLSISVHGAPAECGDVEKGALSSWAGYDVGYCSASNAGYLIARDGRPRRLWTAHYTVAHICTSALCWPSSPVAWVADGTQWSDNGGRWDESLLADYFFDSPEVPVPLVQADEPIITTAVVAAIPAIAAAVLAGLRELYVPGTPAVGAVPATAEGELYGRTRTATTWSVNQAIGAIADAVRAVLPPAGPAVAPGAGVTVSGTFTGRTGSP
jgi:hypothetical protein